MLQTLATIWRRGKLPRWGRMSPSCHKCRRRKTGCCWRKKRGSIVLTARRLCESYPVASLPWKNIYHGQRENNFKREHELNIIRIDLCPCHDMHYLSFLRSCCKTLFTSRLKLTMMMKVHKKTPRNKLPCQIRASAALVQGTSEPTSSQCRGYW